MNANRKLLTILEAADVLGLGRSLMYELVLRGDIASIKIGRARRVPAAALDDFIARQLNSCTAGDASTTMPSRSQAHHDASR